MPEPISPTTPSDVDEMQIYKSIHPPFRPIFTHLSPATTHHSCKILLPTNSSYTTLGPSLPPTTAPPIDPSDPLTALAQTPTSLPITAHRSGQLRVHVSPVVVTRPFSDRRIVTKILPDPSGTYIAIASSDAHVKILSIPSLIVTHSFNIPNSQLVCLSFPEVKNAHDSTLLAGCNDGMLHMFPLLQGRRKRESTSVQAHVGRVHTIAVVGNVVVTGGADGILTFTKFENGTFQKPCLVKSEDTIVSLAVAKDRVLALSRRCVSVWDVETRRELRHLKMSIPFVTSFGEAMEGKKDGDEGDGEEEEEEDGIVISAVSIHACAEERYVIALSDHTLIHVSAKSDIPIVCGEIIAGNIEEIYDMAILSQAEQALTLAVASNSPNISILQVVNENSTSATWKCKDVLQGHSGVVLCAHAREGKKGERFGGEFVTGSRDGTARVWRLGKDEKWSCIGIADGHKQGVGAVAISNNGEYIVTGGADRTLKRWNLTSNSCENYELHALWTILAHEKDVNGVAISPDGSVIATGSQDRTVKIWDSCNGRMKVVCKGHRRGIWSVCFSRKERVVASASADGSVGIWNVETGKCVRRLQGDGSGCVRAAFVGGGRVVGGGMDGVLRVWDAKSGEGGGVGVGGTGKLWGVVEGGEGVVVTGGEDGVLMVWRDCEEEVRERRRRIKEMEGVEMQIVDADIRGGRWEGGVRRAVRMGLWQRVGKIIEGVVLTCEDAGEELRGIVRGIVKDGEWDIVRGMLSCCRDWLACGGGRNAVLASYCLRAVFECVGVDDLVDNLGGEIGLLIDAISAHAERHAARLCSRAGGQAVLKVVLDELGDVAAEGKRRRVLKS